MTWERIRTIQKTPALGREVRYRGSRMSISRSVVFGCTVAGALAAFGVANASDIGFTVHNANRSVSIQRVWTAAAGTSQPWIETYLNTPILDDREFSFNNNVSTCLFDVKIQFSDGVIETFDSINACRGDIVRAE